RWPGRARRRPVPARQGRAAAPRGGRRPGSPPRPPRPRRADHGPRLRRAAEDDGAPARAPRPRADDRHHHAHALGDRRVRRARRAARGRAAALRRGAAAVLRRRRAARRGRVSRPRRDPARAAPRLHAALGRGAGVVDAPEAGAVPLTLYVPAASRLHRLHPVTKVAGLVAFIVAAFVVDRPLALAPLAAAIAALLVPAGGLPNVRRLRVMFVLVFVFSLVVWTLFYGAALAVVLAQRCRGLELGRGGIVARLRRFVPILVPVLIGALRRADRMAMALELRGFNSGRPRTTYLRARAGRGDVLAGAV